MPIIPKTMCDVVLTGHGGLDRLLWREDLPVPIPGDGEVLIRVRASSVNNTDINTRTAWYSKTVRDGTGAGALSGTIAADDADGGWSGRAITFPRIQGTDCCGDIVAVGPGVPEARIGERVLVRALQTTGASGDTFATWTFGSECDGGFAQFAKTYAVDALAVRSDWSDVELASIPCAYATAEGMLQRANVQAERVLVTAHQVVSAALRYSCQSGVGHR